MQEEQMRVVRPSSSDVLIISMIAVSIISFFLSLQHSQADAAELQVASQDKEDAKRSKDKGAKPGTATTETHESHKDVATGSSPDSTGKNARDKSGDTLTPMDQSEDKRDLEMTQRIRKALVDDDTLSTNAKNIKVITVNGIVTLRGPVDSMEERNKIVAKATPIAGGKLKNELEIQLSK
jgi:hyperosmotically inducible periplasmic protein